MTGRYLIHFATADGEEREERWPSVEAFRSWALAQARRYRFTAYEEDEDGEWVVVDQGEIR